MILTFPLPTVDEAALATSGKKIQAVAAYYRRARVTLLNGMEVGPTLSTARSIIGFAAMGMGDIPVAVSEGSYRDVRAQEEERARKNLLFAQACIAEGLDPKNPVRHTTAKSCDTLSCSATAPEGEVLGGVMLYQPDGMGMPAPVLFFCSACWGDRYATPQE